jgi:hypothetical protein
MDASDDRKTTVLTPEATPTDEPGKGLDDIALKGVEKLAAQKQKYIADIVSTKDGNPYFTRSEKVQKAEAYFVGNAFDEINRILAKSESGLTDEERAHLMDQIVLGQMPTYAIHYNAERKPFAEITVPVALTHAAKNNPKLIGAILKSDSFARAMSPLMISENERVSVSEQNRECLLINALIASGKNSRGEKLDFTGTNIQIDLSVDDTDFAQTEKAEITRTEGEVSDAKKSLEGLRMAEKPAFKAFEERMKRLVADANDGIEKNHQVLDAAYKSLREALATTKEGFPALVETKQQETLAAIERFVEAAKDEDEKPKRAELVKTLQDLISSGKYTLQQLEDTIGQDSGYPYDTLAYKLKADSNGKAVIDALKNLRDQMRTNGFKENSIQRATQALDEITVIVNKGDDLDASKGYSPNNGSLKQKISDLESVSSNVGINVDVLRETIAVLLQRTKTKQRAEHQEQEAKKYLDHISAALSGNEAGLIKNYSLTSINLNTVYGLEAAIKSERQSLQNIDGGEEYAQVVAAIGAVEASMTDLANKVSATSDAKRQHGEAVKEQTRQTQIASLAPVWQENPEIIMGLYYLKKRAYTEKAEPSNKRPYASNFVVPVPYGPNESVSISFQDIGAYVDANNHVIFNGKAPSLCQKLEETLETHIGDFDLEAGAGPLTVAAIQRIASEKVAAAGKARTVAEQKATQWGGDMQDLAEHTMDLDERNANLATELAEKQTALREAQAALNRVEAQMGEVESSLKTEAGRAKELAKEADAAKKAAGTAMSTGEAKATTLADQITTMNKELAKLRKIETATKTYREEMVAAEKVGMLSRNGAKKAAQDKLDRTLAQIERETQA